jgi:ppGpp synthetase/RelA/SpoT-type nucleotidyltranferase
MSDVDRQLEFFDSTRTGFEAVEDVLAKILKDALTEAARGRANKDADDEWFSFADAKPQLGVYTLSRRVKDRTRVKRKLEKRSSDGQACDPFYRFLHDIVGNRIVCLHPDDLFDVAMIVDSCCEGSRLSPPSGGFKKAVVRRGDFSTLDLQAFRDKGFTIEEPHQAGYASIHFIFNLGTEFVRYAKDRIGEDAQRGLKVLQQKGIDPRDCFVEVQVRTILEDAWTEVDHAIRYEDEHLANDEELLGHARAMAAYTQAGNNHISIIRELAKRKRTQRAGGMASAPLVPQ